VKNVKIFLRSGKTIAYQQDSGAELEDLKVTVEKSWSDPNTRGSIIVFQDGSEYHINLSAVEMIHISEVTLP